MVASNQDHKIADLLVSIYEHEHLNMNSISIGGAQDTYQEDPSIEFIEGYSFRSGYLSPYFAQTFENNIIQYGSGSLGQTIEESDNMQTGAYLLLTDMMIESQQELHRFMEFA